jgi:hypothetical protein
VQGGVRREGSCIQCTGLGEREWLGPANWNAN